MEAAAEAPHNHDAKTRHILQCFKAAGRSHSLKNYSFTAGNFGDLTKGVEQFNVCVCGKVILIAVTFHCS